MQTRVVRILTLQCCGYMGTCEPYPSQRSCIGTRTQCCDGSTAKHVQQIQLSQLNTIVMLWNKMCLQEVSCCVRHYEMAQDLNHAPQNIVGSGAWMCLGLSNICSKPWHTLDLNMTFVLRMLLPLKLKNFGSLSLSRADFIQNIPLKAIKIGSWVVC